MKKSKKRITIKINEQKILENWRRYRTINEHEEMSDIETQARANLAGAKLNRHGNPRGLEPEMEAIEKAVKKAEEEERLGNRSVKEKLIDFLREKVADLEKSMANEPVEFSDGFVGFANPMNEENSTKKSKVIKGKIK